MPLRRAAMVAKIAARRFNGMREIMSDKKPKPIKLGDVRKAVMAAMRRNKLTSYDVWKLTGKHEADRVPRTAPKRRRTGRRAGTGSRSIGRTRTGGQWPNSPGR
jgi:hypothetical protein